MSAIISGLGQEYCPSKLTVLLICSLVPGWNTVVLAHVPVPS